jgi:hypothetical protein
VRLLKSVAQQRPRIVACSGEYSQSVVGRGGGLTSPETILSRPLDGQSTLRVRANCQASDRADADGQSAYGHAADCGASESDQTQRQAADADHAETQCPECDYAGGNCSHGNDSDRDIADRDYAQSTATSLLGSNIRPDCDTHERNVANGDG